MVARIPLPHPDAQTAFDGWIAITSQAIWVADSRGSYLVRVDVASNKVTSVPIDPRLLAAGDSGLWMISPWGFAPGPPAVSLSRVDPKTGRPSVVKSLPAGSRISVGLGGVWVADGELRLLDPVTMRFIRHFPYEGVGIQVACGALWNWTSSPDYQHPWLLQQLDPANGRVLEQISLPDVANPGRLDEIDGVCWTAAGGTLLGVQPGKGLTVTTAVPSATAIQIAGATAWSWTPDGLIQRIDPRTGEAIGPIWLLPARDLHTDPKGGPDWRLLSAGGSLWLLGGDEIVRYRIPTGN